MMDAIGNKVVKGNLVYWKSKGIVVQVVEIIEPAIDGNPAPSIVVVMGQIAVTDVPRGQEPRIDDLIRTVDPSSEG
jgi:hypothetical protein